VGLAIARHFADKGANVMFADMDETQLVKECAGSGEDGNIRHFAGDLRERLTLANLLSATLDSFDRVDILVNGARQMQVSDPLNLDDGSMEQMLNQNLMPALRLSQLVAKRMIKQAEGQEEGQVGSIINLSSIASRRAQPELLGYSVSCAALDQMTRALSVALAPNRIRVNGVAFGSVMSASLKNTLKTQPDYRDVIEANTPLGRIAAPTELAQAVQYLASDASGFVTGQIMTVDGGRTLLDPVQAPAH
jgi:7-alpha-hydroxysteroid dehydrogenase